MPLTAAIVAVAAHAAHRPRLDRVLPAGRAAVADRPGAVLVGGHQPARAAAGAPLAEPRVRAERRAGAAGRAGAHRVAGGAADGEDFVWWEFVLQDVGVGLRDGHPGRAASARCCCRAGRRFGPRDPAPPEGALRARRRLRRLRHRGRPAAGGQRLHRGVRLRDRARHPAAGHPRLLRGALAGHHRDREAGHLRGVRLAAHLRRPVRRRLGGGRDRRRSRCWSRARRRSRSPSRARGWTPRTRRSWRGSAPRAWPP